VRGPLNADVGRQDEALLDFEGRIVVASSTGKRVVLGAWEHSAVVIDLTTRSASSKLETTFDAGGERLALSDEMDALLAAAYHSYGLASYCCRTGREQWRRKDLKKVQRISLSADGVTAYCGREGAPLSAVDLRSGETVHTVRGARGLYESRFDALRFVDTTTPYLSRPDGGQKIPIDRMTFAILDVCFGPGLLVLSESGGPVRCLDTATGRELWRYEPMAERHVLHLGYQASGPYVLGVEWPYVEGGSKRLIRLSPTDGTVVDMMILGQPADCCFGLDGEVVVLSDGRIIFTAPHKRERLG
jgi:outer membrane protein assembly factor BamB